MTIFRDGNICFHKSVLYIHQFSEKAQKKFSESTHPIGRTILMKIIIQASSGSDEMMYGNVTTQDGQKVLWW